MDNYPNPRSQKTLVVLRIVLVALLACALYTGFHLKQALDAGHELRSQMGDLSLATMTDSSASSSAVSLGEKSLHDALDSVRRTAHHDELWLGLELVGVLGLSAVLRRKRA